MAPLACFLAAAAVATVPGPADYFEARHLTLAHEVPACHPVRPAVARAAADLAVLAGWCDRDEFLPWLRPDEVVAHVARARKACENCGPEFTPGERAALVRSVAEYRRVRAHLEHRAEVEPDRATGLRAYCRWLADRAAPVVKAECQSGPYWDRCERRQAATAFRASGSDGVIVPASYYQPTNR